MNLAFYKVKARGGSKAAQRVVDAFTNDWNPDQPRDSDGKWGEGGGGGSKGPGSLEHHAAQTAFHEAAMNRENEMNSRVPRLANKEKANAHTEAFIAHAAAGAAIVRGEPKEQIAAKVAAAERAGAKAHGGAEQQEMHYSLGKMQERSNPYNVPKEESSRQLSASKQHEHEARMHEESGRKNEAHASYMKAAHKSAAAAQFPNAARLKGEAERVERSFNLAQATQRMRERTAAGEVRGGVLKEPGGSRKETGQNVSKSEAKSNFYKTRERLEAARAAHSSSPLGKPTPEHIRAELKAAAGAHREATAQLMGWGALKEVSNY